MLFQSQAQTCSRCCPDLILKSYPLAGVLDNAFPFLFHAPARVDRLFARGAIAGVRTPPFTGWLKLSAACRFAASSRCSHQTMIGLAIAIEEYVPKITPMNSASENARSTSPPNTTIASTDKNTNPLVMTVRERV